MQITVRGEVKFVPVTSVVLTRSLDDIDDNRFRMFHCPVCTAPIVQYKGHLGYILPDNVPSEFPVLHRCPKCKENYNFQGVSYVV